MHQSTTNRSRQLLYVILIASLFSLLSASYKHFTKPESAQSVGKVDCQPSDARDLDEGTCKEIIIEEEIQLSSLDS